MIKLFIVLVGIAAFSGGALFFEGCLHWWRVASSRIRPRPPAPPHAKDGTDDDDDEEMFI